MKPKGKYYEEEVIVPKVWEEIEVDGNKERVLVSKIVSDYIRSLEKQITNKKKS